MSENLPGREPFQLFRISLPRCANVCGEGACNAIFAPGRQCFNTRATCLSEADYRDSPLAPAGALVELRNGSVLDAANTVVRDADAIFHARLTIEPDAAGVILAAGSPTHYVYMGFDAGALRFFAGGTGTNEAVQGSIDLTAWEGSTVDLFFQIEISGAAEVWLYDPVTYSVQQIASAVIPGGGAFPSGAFCAPIAGLVGSVRGATYGAEGLDAFNGYIGFVRFHSGETLVASEGDQYVTDLYFSRDEMARPRDDIRIRPQLISATPVSSKINISTEGRDLKPLGGRGSLTVSLGDGVSTDRDVDPYYQSRNYRVEDGTRGLFWERMRPRHLYGFLGADVRVYDGYAGDYLQDMQQRLYKLDRAELMAGDRVSFWARDVLTQAEPEKAQWPPKSPGELAADVSLVDDEIITTAHIISDFPISGLVRIGDEIMAYDGIADNLDGTFTWSITGRGEEGSVIDTHQTEDELQWCPVIELTGVYEALSALFAYGTDIEGQYLDRAGWRSEVDEDLPAYRVRRVFPAPDAVIEYAGELARDCGFYLWWDERESKVKIRAVEALGVIPSLLNDSSDLIAGSVSFREKPEDRIDQLWFAYLPKDATGEKDGEFFEFKEVYVRPRESKYKQVSVRKYYSRWLTQSNDVVETVIRIGQQYSETPIEVSFDLDAKDRAIWVGDVVRLKNERIRNEYGEIDERLYVITSATEAAPGHLVSYTAEDTTNLGTAYVYSDDDDEDYTGIAAIDGLRGFYTDDDGLNPDGTEGASYV